MQIGELSTGFTGVRSKPSAITNENTLLARWPQRTDGIYRLLFAASMLEQLRFIRFCGSLDHEPEEGPS